MKVNNETASNLTCKLGGGAALALGMAWHLDSGFLNVFLDCLLGWIYVGFKISQLLWPIV